MSKKITSVEELLKIGKECEKLIEIRKKWKESELVGKIQFKVCIGSNTDLAKKLADELAIAIVDLIKEKKYKDIVVYQSEFFAYSGDLPSLEIIIPEKGQVVFGNLDIKSGLELVEKYITNTEEIIEFLVDNDGNKKCNH